MKESHDCYDQDIAESFLYEDAKAYDPKTGQRLGVNHLRRGTPEWDAREEARVAVGCLCKSHGDIDRSVATRGKTAQYPPF